MLRRAMADDRKLVLDGVMSQADFDQEWHGDQGKADEVDIDIEKQPRHGGVGAGLVGRTIAEARI